LRSTWTNSSRDPIPKITRAKWTGGVAQALEYLLCKHEAKCKPQSRQKKKTKNKKYRVFSNGSKSARKHKERKE
jgi:hypothetical protein